MVDHDTREGGARVVKTVFCKVLVEVVWWRRIDLLLLRTPKCRASSQKPGISEQHSAAPEMVDDFSSDRSIQRYAGQ